MKKQSSVKSLKAPSLIIAAVATIVFAVFIVVILPWVSAYTSANIGGLGSPDTTFLYSGRQLYAIADSYGADGRRLYVILRWTFDLLWPMAYAWFLVSWTRWLASFYQQSWVKQLYWIPIAAMLFDYLENSLVTIVMLLFPKPLYELGTIVSLVGLVKWSTLSVAFVVILILVIGAITIRLLRIKNNT
jgi:hypothetical protein